MIVLLPVIAFISQSFVPRAWPARAAGVAREAEATLRNGHCTVVSSLPADADGPLARVRLRKLRDVSGLWRSFGFAGQGVWHAVRTQRNVRVQLLAGMAAVVLGLVLGITATDWACILLAIGLVLTAETFNTVAEAIVDLCASEYHPLAKIAKDTAAGAVLISSAAAIGVGIAVFGPRLL